MECGIVCFGQRGLKNPKLDNFAPRCCASNDSAQCAAIRGPSWRCHSKPLDKICRTFFTHSLLFTDTGVSTALCMFDWMSWMEHVTIHECLSENVYKRGYAS